MAITTEQEQQWDQFIYPVVVVNDRSLQMTKLTVGNQVSWVPNTEFVQSYIESFDWYAPKTQEIKERAAEIILNRNPETTQRNNLSSMIQILSKLSTEISTARGLGTIDASDLNTANSVFTELLWIDGIRSHSNSLEANLLTISTTNWQDIASFDVQGGTGDGSLVGGWPI